MDTSFSDSIDGCGTINLGAQRLLYFCSGYFAYRGAQTVVDLYVLLV